jgi:formate C-acetyltransferase
MSLSDRVRCLREQSVNAPATISAERALLITEFYEQDVGATSAAVRRARAFRHVLEQKHIFIGEGELIVGERGPAPKAVSTFPEICCHTLTDLDILDSREKVSFAVSDDVRQTFRDRLIPFWKTRSLREMIFNEMTPEWRDAYEGGVFTEFMEQRAPGHTVLDSNVISSEASRAWIT